MRTDDNAEVATVSVTPRDDEEDEPAEDDEADVVDTEGALKESSDEIEQ